MQVKILGPRGSISRSGANYRKYGGSTACIELSFKNLKIIIDAGTGIQNLEKSLKKDDKVVFLFSHYHKDHTEGLTAFAPFFQGGLKLYAPLLNGMKTADEAFEMIFNGTTFPIKWQQIPKHDIKSFVPGSSFKIDDIKIETFLTSHLGGCVAFKITDGKQIFGYSGDHEISSKDDKIFSFLSGCDVALVDASYTKNELKTHKGWGHSGYEEWLPLDKNVKNIVLFHHSPKHDDAKLSKIHTHAKKLFKYSKVHMAQENAIIGKKAKTPKKNHCFFCDFRQEISAFSDTHLVLSKILQKAKELCKANAGTIYLKKDDELVFASAQNNTLFPNSKANKFFYLKSSMKIDEKSLAGYCAKTGKILNVADVYALKNTPYSFNHDFDKMTGYRCKSMLLMPFINKNGKIIGIMQLINATKHGKIVPFSKEDEEIIKKLASISALSLESAMLTEEMIMRMLEVSALRDPKETAAHVWRVGSMAAELYESWASEQNVDVETMLATKSKLRLAATLHDIGKVGIPDAILKKPSKLSSDEMEIMKSHAYMGAKLFEGSNNEIEKIAYDIALHHHAHWDGTGYTGDESIKSPAGENIPIFARITTIADVYDALISKRVYKEAWDKKDVMQTLKEGAGKMFDPNLIKHFEKIQPIIEMIVKRYE